MDIKDYQIKAAKTSLQYKDTFGLLYASLGLGNEAGEVLGKIKKYIRGDYDIKELREKIIGELGDVLWYLSELSSQVDLNLNDIAEQNINKLQDRQKRNCIRGDGDNR